MLPDPPRRLIGSALSGSRILAAVLLFCLAPAGAMGWHPRKNAPPTASSAETYDSASFVNELGRLESELEIARKSPATLRAFRDSLPATWTVKSGEQQYDVPTAPLTSRIDDAMKEPAVRELKLNQARDFLNALSAEISSASGLQPVDPASARASLDQILARREFAQPEPAKLVGPLQGAHRRNNSWMRSIDCSAGSAANDRWVKSCFGSAFHWRRF